MIKVIFQNSKNEERTIGLVNTKEEALSVINKFMEERNFKSYYTRVWEENGRLKFDVGSWTEFFYCDGLTWDDWKGTSEEKNKEKNETHKTETATEE